MSRAITILMTVAMAGALSILPGCQSGPDAADADLTPLYTADGRARSLVTDTAAVAALRAEQAPTAGVPWYHDRKDQRTTLIAGYQSPATLGIRTRTHDRIHATSGGRVHDHYTRRTFRYESIDGAR